jgi:signal transduction histidine kinase
VVVAEMVAEALNLVEVSLRGTGVVLEKNIPADLPTLLGDKGKLEQVLVNLMKNSIDAMPSGGRLIVSVVKVGASRIGISVADTGTGISPEVQAKIFEPFFTTKEVGKGTGLGLSIAYGIVSEHGGELTVSSKQGAGTEFLMVLPILGQEVVSAMQRSPGGA